MIETTCGQRRAASGRVVRRASAHAAGGDSGGGRRSIGKLGRLDLHGQGEQGAALLPAAKAKAARAVARRVLRAWGVLKGDMATGAAV